MEPRNLEEAMPYMQDQPARRKRWANMTEGLDRSRRIMTEVLLDNQVRLGEQRKRGMLNEDTILTTDFSPFTTFALPIIRRVFPRLILNDLVNVIPMNSPNGKVFYLDFERAETTAGSPGSRTNLADVADFSQSYAEAPEATQVPQVSMRLTDSDITTKTKKLKAQWSLEAEQDAMSQFGLDLPGEMTGVISDEIARETDREGILSLFNFAGAGDVDWHYTVPVSGPYSLNDPKVWGRTLYDAIIDANALIKRKRYRGANWIIGGTTAVTRLEKLEEFRLAPSGGPDRQIVSGPNLFGTLSNRWQVYEDPWLDDTLVAEQLLLGYKGTSAFDMAAVFCPYIGLMMTAPFTNPQDLTTVRAAMSRWGFKGLIPEAYATVTITA